MVLKPIASMFILVLLMATICYAQKDTVKPIEVGSTAPDFELKGIDGVNYNLKSYMAAKVVVIIFTANHCPTAQAYEDRMIQLVNDYKSKNVSIVAISSNNPEAVRLDEMGYTDLGDSMEDMKKRAKDRGFNFPYLYDGDEQAAVKAYGALTTPHVFILDDKRVVRFVGRIDDSENPANVTTHDTRDAIDALLQGREVAVETTKTFGCSIKWAYKKESAKEALERWNSEEVNLEMIDLDDIAVVMKNDSENLRLINVWATWCGPCVAEFPQLIEIFRMYRNREFEMVTISADEPGRKDKVETFLKKNYASSKNYLCSSSDRYQFIEAIDEQWPGSLPYTLLLKPGGEIIYKKLGMIDDLELKKAIVEYVGRYYH